LNQQFPIFFLWTIPRVVPSIYVKISLEIPEKRFFNIQWDRGIIFDRVEASQDKVEDADG
jgi:hypothetical protein